VKIYSASKKCVSSDHQKSVETHTHYPPPNSKPQYSSEEQTESSPREVVVVVVAILDYGNARKHWTPLEIATDCASRSGKR
jgi:hypothetical protein